MSPARSAKDGAMRAVNAAPGLLGGSLTGCGFAAGFTEQVVDRLVLG